jgi:NAD(P)-dependent dehydrogenase (short-subunit alcohol dehydrogenase family)
MTGRLQGKVAVVTGGASGIGLATVERFVAEGARVVFCDLAPASRDELVGEYGPTLGTMHYVRSTGDAHDGMAIAERLGDAVRFVACDVSRSDQLTAVIATAVDEFGGLDVMFNNAAVGQHGGSVVDCPEDVFDRTIEVNLKGVWLGIKLAAPALVARGGGSIISTSSTLGLRGAPGAGAYSAAKAAVLGLTRVAAQELASSYVRVNCICPGGVVTPATLNEVGDEPRPEALVRRILTSLHPTPRPGDVDDVASTAVWLASDEASFVNGQAIVVDGGLTAEYDARLRHGPMGLLAP